MQPDFDKFVDTRHPDAMVNNYTRLQKSFLKLGVKFDTRTANALMREEPGVALRLLYSLKQNLGQVNKDVQVGPRQACGIGACMLHHRRPLVHVTYVTLRTSGAMPTRASILIPPLCFEKKFQNSGRLGKELGASIPVTRTLLEAQQHDTIREKSSSNAQRFFEDSMRLTAENPNALMASMHLRRYTEEMYRQEKAAGTGTLQERASLAAERATFRSSQLTKMEHGRGDKVKKLQHDDAVHATLMKHKVAMTGMGGVYLSPWLQIHKSYVGPPPCLQTSPLTPLINLLLRASG